MNAGIRPFGFAPQRFEKAAYTPVVELGRVGLRLVLSPDQGNCFAATLTANATLIVRRPIDGQTVNLWLTQDATGGRTITWPSAFKWPSGSAGTLSTAANAIDLLVASYRGRTKLWYCTLMKGFA